MQAIIVEKPYRFVPPHRGDWVPSLIQAARLNDLYLNRFEGIASHEVRGAELLRDSLRQGHGIVLAPNHCRYADPIAIGWLARAVKVNVYSMASWHLFNQSWLLSFSIRMCGGFSVYREGLDRQSLDTAIDALVEAKRPLVVFPEGTVFRTNDILQPLLDGVAFLSRTAARKRAKKDGGKVVIHPVAIKYLFRGDVEKAVEPVVSALEQRFAISNPYVHDGLLTRVKRLGQTLLAIKEVEYLGCPQTGSVAERQQQLIEHILTSVETQWLGSRQDDKLLPRIKLLRSTLVPKLKALDRSDPQRDAIWAALRNLYVTQQIASHPVEYLDSPTDTRVLETVERLEEDVRDRCTIHRPLHAILEVGEAIEVPTDKPPRHAEDSVIVDLTTAIRGMLARLSHEAKPYIGS